MHFKGGYRQFIKIRRFCTKFQSLPEKNIENVKSFLPEPEYDIKFFCDPLNRNYIFNNIQRRKGIGDIDKVIELSQKPNERETFLNELSKLPNNTDPRVLEYENNPHVLKVCGSIRNCEFVQLEFSQICKRLNLIQTKKMGPLLGSRGYIIKGNLADLENALILYTVGKLINNGFKLVSVPDIIPTEIIKRCGLAVEGPRTLVFNLNEHYGDKYKYSLSGTAEISLAAKLMNARLSYEDLPLKMAAVSRCYRAETSHIESEKGIYRVHEFTKVEMFVCSKEDQSSKIFQYLQDVQEDLFSSLGLHFKILDMPANELGASAYRKVDIEGWMPGRKRFGELSSCSNCTDYQSRRLNIKYKSHNGELNYVHTLNGTACAIPRMLIAVCETYQTEDGSIIIPVPLIPFMQGEVSIKKKPIPNGIINQRYSKRTLMKVTEKQ